MWRKEEAWVTEMRPRIDRYQDAAGAVAGCGATLTCDTAGTQLVLTLATAPHPAVIDHLVDELSPLWPGFLAPAGVGLLIVDGGEWDGEEMALRFHQRRTAG